MTLTGPDLFRVAADQIEAHPEKYDQGTWGADEELGIGAEYLKVADRMAINNCGTKACIAGWATAFNVMNPDVRSKLESGIYDVGKIARDLLGLSDEDATRLFDEHWAPDEALTVPQALRMLADGSSVEDVSEWVDEG